MHGFLNIFGAGLLACAGVTGEEVEACVAATESKDFSFSEDKFKWRNHKVETAAIADCRRDFFHGFGSCSFAEPVADLQELGLI